MKIRFRCNQCQADEEFNMRERKEGEAITAFVENAAQVAGAVHCAMNPTCPCRRVDLLIPIRPDGTVGGIQVPESIQKVETKCKPV